MRQQKAFTLVELLVAMAIIGLLIGLSLFGIAAAQRNARDTARRAALQDINAGIADYLTIEGAFPRDIRIDDNTVYIARLSGGGGGVLLNAADSSNCTAPNKCVLVPLDGAARTESNDTGGSSPTTFGTGTSPNSSLYCFATRSDGYSLAVELENGDVAQGGTSTQDCTP